jgi:hypothetical protein
VQSGKFKGEVRVGFQRAERVGRKDKGLLKFVHARMDCCYEYKYFGAEEVSIVGDLKATRGSMLQPCVGLIMPSHKPLNLLA